MRQLEVASDSPLALGSGEGLALGGWQSDDCAQLPLLPLRFRSRASRGARGGDDDTGEISPAEEREEGEAPTKPPDRLDRCHCSPTVLALSSLRAATTQGKQREG